MNWLLIGEIVVAFSAILIFYLICAALVGKIIRCGMDE